MSQLARDQRKLREARKLAAAVQSPGIADEVAEAVTALKRAEDRSAELLRERVLRP